MKKRHAQELSRNQPILRFDVILQHDWPIEQCLLHIRVFFGGKTKKPCFDLFIHWLINHLTNTYRIHFSRSYENRSIVFMLITTNLLFHFFSLVNYSFPYFLYLLHFALSVSFVRFYLHFSFTSSSLQSASPLQSNRNY